MTQETPAPAPAPASGQALRPSLVERIKGILLRPEREWEVIREEDDSLEHLFRGYAFPLAAIGPVCLLISRMAFHDMDGLLSHLVDALVMWVLSIAAVLALGLLIEILAKSFDGIDSRVAAMKVAVYSATAPWVLGVLFLVPRVGYSLAPILSLYGLFLVYTGLPRLMGSPREKTGAYALLVGIVALVGYLLAGRLL